MAEKIMKAVELSKTSAAFRKEHDLDSLVDRGWQPFRKYDGCMGIAVLEEKGPRGMYSRTGKPVTSCDHILAALHRGMRDYFSVGGTPIAVLGEVWHPARTFPEISGAFRAHRADPSLLFVMFDMAHAFADEPPYVSNMNAPFWQRMATLRRLEEFSTTADFVGPLRVAQVLMLRTAVEDSARAVVSQGGYDGLVLRDPDAAYTVGLCKQGQIVKVKPLLSLDLLVQEIATEPGAKTGRPVHTLRVTYRGVDSWVGAGVPHDKTLLGRGDIVQIDCLGLTEDGKLREPRFVAVRHDKEFQDE